MRTGRLGAWLGLVGLALLGMGPLQAEEPVAPAAGAEKLPPTMAQECIASCQGPEPITRDDPDLLSGLYFTGEYLMVMPRSGPMDFGVAASRAAPSSGVVESVKWSDSFGYRIGAGYRLCEGWAVGVLYTSFTAKDKGTASAPEGGELLPTLSQRGIPNDVASGNAEASIAYTTVDFEVSKSLRLDESLGLRFFAGGRYAEINPGIKASYFGSTLGVTTDEGRSTDQFEGAGLNAGGECDWKFYHNWGLFAKARASLVYGQFKNTFSEGLLGGATLSSISQTQDRLVPVAEAGVGLFYQGEHMFFGAGYDLTNWFNMNNTLDFTGAVLPRPAAAKSDLMFQGVSAKVGFIF